MRNEEKEEICRKCQGARIGGIATLGVALIISCVYHPDEKECPYVGDQQHTQRDSYVLPAQFANSAVTVATTALPLSHPYKVLEYEDPEIKGNSISVLDFTASRLA